MPDLGLIYSNEVARARHAQQIIKIVQLILLVDIDTGFGGVLNVARTLVIMAWKDAAAIERIKCNVEARAAAIFPEALSQLINGKKYC
ncbi:hypothetical protein [Neobacillus sp. PS3-40]|uniref:hypothetical protein n=1 Tax=Neobacillus sp. PS3-40 TaxID=3070679 RepID=UPI0035A8AAC4